MKKTTCINIIFFAIIFFSINISVFGQATLPFLYDAGNPGTNITGLTQSSLGSDYSTSPKMKFGSTNSSLILNFNGTPGILTFNIKWNQGTATARFPGEFILQESSDGSNHTTVQLYNSINGTLLQNTVIVTETFSTLLSTTRFLKWIYTSKTNGNIALGAINLSEGSIVSVSPGILNSFTYINGNGPSSEQSFTVNGNKLVNNITIIPPLDYEISVGTGASFIATNPIILTQTSGIIPATTIYTRLKSGIAALSYNENITLVSNGANSKTVACNGFVTTQPTITLLDITDPTLNAIAGSKVSQTINVSGVNLNVDLVLSISGTDAGLFSLSQYLVSQSAGFVPNTNVNIMYNPTVVGSNTATLTMMSSGALTVTRTLNGNATIGTGINSVKIPIIVSVENENIIFTASEGESVVIYNSLGQMLIQKLTVEGKNIIPIYIHGVIMVKVGTKVAKIII